MSDRTDDPTSAPNTPQDITLHFEKGFPTKLSAGKTDIMDRLDLFIALNEIGKKHGIGRIDIVEVGAFGLPTRFCPEDAY